MADPADVLAFLANSKNRVRTLDALAEEPCSRPELHEETDIARATLGRILRDLEDRGWVTMDGQRYEATPQGRHMVREFCLMCDTVSALEDLGTLLQWLPTDRFTFALSALADARVTRPTPADSIAPIRRAGALMSESNDIFGLTSVFAPEALEGNHAAMGAGEQRFEVVFTSDVVEVVAAEAETREMMRDLLTTDGTTCYLYEDELSYPYNVWIIDGEAVIGVADDEGAPKALIETSDPAVCQWVRSTITAHQDDATLLRPADLPE